jgi:malonyl-CoA/methylmalonyl-CoA synthetase
MPKHFLENVRCQFGAQPKRTALVYQGRGYSYGETEAMALGWAAQLQSLGLEPGDRVALLVPDKLAFLLAQLGTLFAGGVSVPLNPRYPREEIRYFLADSGARFAVVGTELRSLVDAVRPELPELRALVEEAAAPSRQGFRDPASGPNDAVLMVYSSGTTGWPKGVVHTQTSMASGLLALQSSWRVSPDDVVVNVLPLFHVHGLCFATLMTLLACGCVLLDDFQPERTLEIVGRGSIFMAVPTIYYRLLEQPDFRSRAKSWTNVRLFTCGSAPIRPEVLGELETIIDRPVINRYGMSEAFVITSLPLDGPWPRGSVGLPLDGIDVRVAGDNHVSSMPGELGTVYLRGPNLFQGYWGKPEATRAAFDGEWFDTGDLGFRDRNGFLTLVGRKHDLIITNGYNVYPQVVERVINACPGVKESAVFGVPDDRRGERVVAAVVPDDPGIDVERLTTFWNDRLVDYQRPLEVIFVESLPRNAMGKVMRQQLRDRVARSQA